MSKRNNDEIFDALEILVEYAHVTPRKALHIVDVVINKKPLKPRPTKLRVLGRIYGKSHNDILIQCSKVLSKIRYLETKGVIQLLEELYSCKDKTVQSAVLHEFENLAQYNLFVLQQIGYKTQEQLLAVLESWNNKRLLSNFEILIITAKELLTPTFEGSSMPDYKTFTLHSGSLAVTSDLKTIRKRIILLLKKLYDILGNNLPLQVRVLQALQNATQTPHSYVYGDDLEQMVWEDTNDVIDIYLKILPGAENEIIQNIEEQKIWFKRRFEKKLPKKLSLLDEAIKSNTAYEMFKVFVGFDGRLDPDQNFNGDRQTRSQKIDEFVSGISDDNFEEWRKKILFVVKNYSVSEPGNYGYFEMFLSKLGIKKTSLAVRLIEENEKELAPFFLSLLSGIWKNDPTKAKEMISNWVDESKYLPICAFIFVVTDDFDGVLLDKIINQAKKRKDILALNNALRSILHHYPKNTKLKSVFLDVITELYKMKNAQWIYNLWYQGDLILNDLNEDDWHVIFNGLLIVPRIDYQTEEILKYSANKYPENIIKFFHKRVEIKSKKKSTIGDWYDGVPFNFHKLGEVLRPHSRIIIPILLGWYKDGGKKHNWLFKWEASHLFEEIFPKLDTVAEKALITLANKGTKESRDVIFSVLSKYKGGSHLWGVVKALVKQYSKTKEYGDVRDHLFSYLTLTGVVTGEDGFVRAYKAKKAEIQEIKNDPDKSVQKFLADYENYLNERIVSEQKRTNEQIELMKRGIN